MRRLEGASELLDGPLDDRDALAGNLRDLKRINRLLGGVQLSRIALASFADGARPLSVVDVGTGGADIPVAVRRTWKGPNDPPSFTAVDSRPEVVALARQWVADPSVDPIVGDGLALPWPDGTFDVAHASLVLHHLDPVDAQAFLAELRRVSSRGVVINDLNRAWIHWLGAWLLGHLLTRNRLTRSDAPLSVRRAYTPREMAKLLRAAGLRPTAIRRGILGHRYAISGVPDRAAPEVRDAR